MASQAVRLAMPEMRDVLMLFGRGEAFGLESR